MLRLDTQFDIHNLPCTRLFKVITPAELIERGTAAQVMQA